MTSTTIQWEELDEAQYHKLQKELLKAKGTAVQREFLQAAKSNDHFVGYIADRVEAKEGEKVLVFDGALTEQSFKDPPADLESRMYELWHQAPPRTACRVSFWAGVTLEHVRQGKIAEASWLVTNGAAAESGEERIDRALALSGEAGNKAVDDCVRTIFRRMSGLPAARGNRSVFVDCTFGRGWWRERLVRQILARGDDVESRAALLAPVRSNLACWESLVTLVVSRGSVFGSANVQDALVNCLAKRSREDPNTPLRNSTTLRIVLRRLSNIAASREIGMLAFHELTALVDDLLRTVEAAHTNSVGNPHPSNPPATIKGDDSQP